MRFDRSLLKTTRPEIQLLLFCSRTALDAAAVGEIRRLLAHETVTWRYLVTLARMHGVASLVEYHLNRLNVTLPETEAHELAEASRRIVLRNLHLLGETLQLVQLLGEHGISAIPYKGAVLASLVYGNINLRAFNDIDILVRGDDLSRARDLLFVRGYRQVVEGGQLPADGGVFKRTYQGYNLSQPNTQVVVDLQERFGIRYSSFLLYFDELWERHIEVSMKQQSIGTFSPEDYLLILCAHGTQHRWLSLKWICDIAELLRAFPDLDWMQALARAEAMKASRLLYVGLLLAQTCLDAPLPETVCRLIREDGQAERLALQTYQWLFRHPDTLGAVLERQAFEFRFDFHVRQQWRNKLACMVFLIGRRLSPKASDQAHVPLPRTFSFVHYLLRPVFILRRYSSYPLRKPER
jgi:hypothetical protein